MSRPKLRIVEIINVFEKKSFWNGFQYVLICELLLLFAVRIGIIYALSAFVGSLVASLFLQNMPAVGASGALYGLLGTLLSELVWNWKFHSNKVHLFFLLLPFLNALFEYWSTFLINWMQISAIASLVFVFVCNFVLGFLPYVDNFASMGGFISGFLLGSVFLLCPQIQPVAPNKGGLIDYGVKSYVKLKLKEKLDRPVLRIVSLILFSLLYVVFSSCFYSLINFNLHR